MVLTSNFLLSYSFHSSFVCIYCNVIFSFSYVIRYLFLCTRLRLFFSLVSLFICTSIGVLNYVSGGLYLSFFKISMWICFVYVFIISSHFDLSTHFFNFFNIFSIYFYFRIIFSFLEQISNIYSLFLLIYPVLYCSLSFCYTLRNR